METLNKDILKAYEHALYNQMSGCYEPMLRFSFEHPKEFKLIQTMYRKRTSIKQSIEAMQLTNQPIYWFTLTFNNKKDKSMVQTKRKAATTFLNDLTMYYLLIEEYGEDTNRYHLHGFLILKPSKTFEDFRKWHSRQNLRELPSEASIKKRVYYVTNYLVKSIPRIRRGKTLVKLTNAYKKKKTLIRDFPNLGEEIKQELTAMSVDLF